MSVPRFFIDAEFLLGEVVTLPHASRITHTTFCACVRVR